MGVWASKMLEWALKGFEDDPANICMLGLDAAGKTTITYKLKLNEVVCTIPTIGFNVETISVGKGVTMTIWDVGGQAVLRPLWHHYYQNARGLVYVVDSSDRQRMGSAKEELHAILQADEMRGVPFCVMANKQDMPSEYPTLSLMTLLADAMSTSEVADALGLGGIRDRPWHIQATCATTGEGIFEGLHELAAHVKHFKRH